MIKISNLSKSYANVAALTSFSISIDRATIFAFVGPNGAGKSTTVNILTGVVSPTSGSVKILGYDLATQSMEIKKRIGVLPEIPSLFDRLTGEEHLTFIGTLYGLDESTCRTRVGELLAYLEIDSARNRFTATYSQGMKKKLGFASAIIHAPMVVFLDEPFESVDPISRAKMKKVLARMKAKGALIVMTSHGLAEVEDFCDEVAIINKGELVFRSATRDIRAGIGDGVNRETYTSLEEIFITAVAGSKEDLLKQELSWL